MKADPERKAPLNVSSKVAPDLLVSFRCQDALGVVLTRVQVLGTKVQLLLTQLACEHGKQC